MKLCKKKTYTYVGIENRETTTDYVTDEDVLNFHGEEFFNLWKGYVKDIPKLFIESKHYVYFEDYKFYAYRAHQYLNS